VKRHVNLLVDENAKKDGVDGLLASLNISERLSTLISEAGLDWTLTRLATMMGVAFLIGAVGSLWIPIPTSPLARALGTGLCAACLPLLYASKKRSSRIAEFESQLPDALDFLGRSMRAGHAFTISLEMVGQELQEPLGQEFRALFNEQNLGASLERAFAGFSRRVPISDVRFFSSAVLLQRQTGGNLSEILNRLSQIIRERFRLKGQVKAVSAHGRMTATILTLMPLGTVAGLLLTSPGYLNPLLEDPLGRKIAAAGVGALFLGNFFIRKIVKIKV
jgi:tight adherence protein B